MLQFSELDPSQPYGIPPPALNGGWFTGKPFAPDAGWRTFPVRPQVEDMLAGLASTTPGATSLMPGGTRPGNNEQTTPGCTYYPNTRILCG